MWAAYCIAILFWHLLPVPLLKILFYLYVREHSEQCRQIKKRSVFWDVMLCNPFLELTNVQDEHMTSSIRLDE
jgi:predicted membrane protein